MILSLFGDRAQIHCWEPSLTKLLLEKILLHIVSQIRNLLPCNMETIVLSGLLPSPQSHSTGSSCKRKLAAFMLDGIIVGGMPRKTAGTQWVK